MGEPSLEGESRVMDGHEDLLRPGVVLRDFLLSLLLVHLLTFLKGAPLSSFGSLPASSIVARHMPKFAYGVSPAASVNFLVVPNSVFGTPWTLSVIPSTPTSESSILRLGFQLLFYVTSLGGVSTNWA